jgi:hypothetical protein
VVLGEFGSSLQTIPDVVFMNDLVAYLSAVFPANDGAHRPIVSWIWNAWTPADPALGGILGADSLSVSWPKINYLITAGLKPWYLPPSASSSRPIVLPITATNTTATPVCSAAYTLTNTGRGRVHSAALQLVLKGTARAPILVPWTLTVTNTNYTGLAQAVGLNQTSISKGAVSGTADAYYQILWPAGSNNVTIGMVVSSSASNLTPTTVAINGVACQLVPSTATVAAPVSTPAATAAAAVTPAVPVARTAAPVAVQQATPVATKVPENPTR